MGSRRRASQAVNFRGRRLQKTPLARTLLTARLAFPSLLSSSAAKRRVVGIIRNYLRIRMNVCGSMDDFAFGVSTAMRGSYTSRVANGVKSYHEDAKGRGGVSLLQLKFGKQRRLAFLYCGLAALISTNSGRKSDFGIATISKGAVNA